MPLALGADGPGCELERTNLDHTPYAGALCHSTHAIDAATAVRVSAYPQTSVLPQ